MFINIKASICFTSVILAIGIVTGSALMGMTLIPIIAAILGGYLLNVGIADILTKVSQTEKVKQQEPWDNND